MATPQPGGNARALSYREDFLVTGAVAAAPRTALAPLERIKLVLQTEPALRRHGNALCDDMLRGTNSASSSATSLRGAVACARLLYRRDGILGFWRGNVIGCARYAPTQAVAISFKDTFHKLFGRDRRRDGFGIWATGQLMEGAVAGVVAQCVGHPFDFARTRLACDINRVAEATAMDVAGQRYGARQFGGGGGSRQVLVSTLQAPGQGVGALYRGFTAGCMHAIVHRAVLLGGFGIATETDLGAAPLQRLALAAAPVVVAATATSSLSESQEDTLLRAAALAEQLLIGWGIAAVATLAAHPLDTLKHRAMLIPMDRSRPHGAVALAQTVLREEGLRGFFRAGGLNVARCLGTGAVLAAVDPARAAYVRWRGADDVAFGPTARSKYIQKRNFNDWKY